MRWKGRKQTYASKDVLDLIRVDRSAMILSGKPLLGHSSFSLSLMLCSSRGQARWSLDLIIVVVGL